jgi:hypothetical protein
MPSTSNLGTELIKRLRNDDTADIAFVFTTDDQPVDIGQRAFRLEFCTKQTMDVKETIDVPIGTHRVVGITNMLRVPVAQLRDDMPDTDYTLYLHEILNGTNREPIGHLTFCWQTIPDAFKPGFPTEPLNLRVNYATLTGQYAVLNALILVGLGYVQVGSYALATALQITGATLIRVLTDERWENQRTLYLKEPGQPFERITTITMP